MDWGRADLLAWIRANYQGTLIVNRGGAGPADLGKDIESGLADIVAIGRLALANPDLVHRLKNNLPLNEANPATFYGGGAEGYTDYPALPAKRGLGAAAERIAAFVRR